MKTFLLALLLLTAPLAAMAAVDAPPPDQEETSKPSMQAAEKNSPTEDEQAADAEPVTPLDPKAYPEDAEFLFLRSCAGYNKQKLPYCRCIFRGLKAKMDFEQFLDLARTKDATNDPRFIAVSTVCIKANPNDYNE